MAVATKYKIKFTCGHSEIKDLSDTPAGKRANKATWIEGLNSEYGDEQRIYYLAMTNNPERGWEVADYTIDFLDWGSKESLSSR